MKPEPDKLPGELFFDGHGCGLRLLGLFAGLGTTICLSLFLIGQFQGVWEFLVGIIYIFVSVFIFFALTFTVHQVRINVPARTYSLQNGDWPFYRTFIGTLDDVEIHLTTGFAPGLARAPLSSSFWVKAYLVWKDNGQPNLLLWSEHEHERAALESKIPDAVAGARDLAARLQVPVRIELGDEKGSGSLLTPIVNRGRLKRWLVLIAARPVDIATTSSAAGMHGSRFFIRPGTTRRLSACSMRRTRSSPCGYWPIA